MKKIIHIAALAVLAFFLSRGPLMIDSFIIGSSFIAYMVSVSHKNLYLLIPVIMAMITNIPKGLDSWGYMAAALVCAIVFALAGFDKLKLWQTSLIAGSIVVICVSIYNLAFGSVYKISPAELLLDGVLTAIIVFVLENVFSSYRRCRKTKATLAKKKQIEGLEGYIFVTLALIHGTGLDFAIWMTIVFIVIWVLNERESKTAIHLTVAGSITAALMGEAQWGIMATLAVATFLAGYIKGRGVVITTLIFAMICWGLGHVESGVVLGVDTYGLIITLMTFAVVYWRFGKKKPMRVDVAASQKAAGENMGYENAQPQENGDSYGWEEIEKDKIALVISDGMGKGVRAAAESRLVTGTILDLLKRGVPIEEAMTLMNSIMLIKSENDSYATLDLVTIDKITGKAMFYKIGAAPSLIKKQNRIEEVQLAAVPLGIVGGMKVRHVETTVRKGDKIIMMSDGVSDIGVETIKKTIKATKQKQGEHSTQTAAKLCERLIEKASEYYLGNERDDLTVMVARIL